MSLSKSISTEHAKAPWLYRIPYPIVVIFIIFAVCLFALGIVYHRYRISEQIEEYQGILNSISSLKTQQIVRWKKERLGDALAVLMTPIMRQAVAAYLRNPKSRHLSDQILTTMRIMRSAYEYEDIDLADSSLNILLTTASQSTACPDLLHAAAAQAEKERVPHFTDFHRSTTGRIHFSMIVPVFEGLESTSSAFFIVAIDPYAVLYPLIQSVPIDSDSLETLLVRREGDDVVFLNELRHQKNTALQLRFPLAKTALPAAMTVLGKEGFVRGFDYRGIKVIALVLAIPDTPWFMVAKIDESEVFSPLRTDLFKTMAIIVLLTLGAFSLIIYYFHRERLDRLRSEYEALAERHALTEHFEYLTKYANDIIIVLDDSWNIIEANDRAISSYGYSLGELLRIDYARLIESPSREIVARRRQALERGESLLIEETHRRKDGSIFPAEASIRPIVSHGITYYQYIIRDITERKTAERLLYDRNQHLAMIINSAPVGIYDLDLDGRIKSIWNPAAEKLFGWKREEVLGKFLPTVPELSMSEYEALHSITMQGESLTDVALERQRKGGSPVAISLSVSPLHDQEGNITGMLSIAVDMTKRKEMENQLRLLNLTLEQKVAERTSRLRNINEELEAFSYSVSHDLRAPLRSIDGFSQAVMEDYEDKLDASGRDHLKRIRAATQRMGLLIDDLLQLSRITRVDMRTVEINLSSLASTAARETEEQTKRRIAWKIPEGLSATGDPKLLTIVLRNLFDNAVKFTAAKENPTIEFGRTVMNGTSWFYVRDNGVGFDPKYKDKLFTAFQRLHSAKDYPGTGIGLATVKRIIGRHGGEVWADGAIDAGAAFFFTIPGGRTEEQECMQ